MGLTAALYLAQAVIVVMMGIYFYNLLKDRSGTRSAQDQESRKELDKLTQLRSLALAEPLAERIRPRTFADVVGQLEGIKALQAALCGPNPQHVIIYGPPGIGKTAAARLVLEQAQQNPHSPWGPDARFVEVDATTMRFDERGIADPLIGSVHDPIYQGAGPLGMSGIPQPRPGAVTRAHGGVLFLDEIGELHGVQLNKLLKVLEDRRVNLESAYYNAEDRAVPAHIRDIFENGLPADFRMVGATTRQPHEIPSALRSRCMELFFRPLFPDEIGQIARRAAQRLDMELPEDAVTCIQRHATSGREAVNIVQMAASLAMGQGANQLRESDVQWVVSTCHYQPHLETNISDQPQVGVTNGLAVVGPSMGAVLEIEAAVLPAAAGQGRVTVTGVVEEEEMGGPAGRVLKRRGTGRAAVDVVLTALRQLLGTNPRDFDIHVNFPGGVPVDRPSAGVAMAVAIASALLREPVQPGVAMTGEMSVRSRIRPVGGVPEKLEAARRAGCHTVLVPADNWEERFREMNLTILPVQDLTEVLAATLVSGFTARVEPARVVEVSFGRSG